MMGKNYIGGRWQAAVGNRTFESRNPAHTGDVVGVFARSDAHDIAAATASAAAALPSWRLVPPPERGEILHRVATLLEARKEDLARLMTREMGKVLAEARGDV